MIKRSAWGLVCVLGLNGLTRAQTGGDPVLTSHVLMVMASVEECITVDELLRKSCARVGWKLPDKNQTYCELPATPFQARTARAYAAFKETYRAEVAASAADLADVMRQANKGFDKQFAEMRAGTISMTGLESLSRQMNGQCRVIERDGLVPYRKPR
jgi:hypothetical protein